MTKTATVHMEVSKLAKGAVQYKENTDDPRFLIGTLYLRKVGMGHLLLEGERSREFPTHIKVTIEVEERHTV
jgi:hypothetical protein